MDSKNFPHKIPYEILAIQIDKLYQKEFPEGADRAIEDHCEYIATFIEASGWTLEDYMHEYITRGLEEFFGDPKAN